MSIKELLAMHKQILADDQFLVGHAINKHLKDMFIDLEASLSLPDQKTGIYNLACDIEIKIAKMIGELESGKYRVEMVRLIQNELEKFTLQQE